MVHSLASTIQDFRPIHGILSMHHRKQAETWNCLVCGASQSLTNQVGWYLPLGSMFVVERASTGEVGISVEHTREFVRRVNTTLCSRPVRVKHIHFLYVCACTYREKISDAAPMCLTGDSRIYCWHTAFFLALSHVYGTA